jgi:hypothetical protein
VKDLPTQTPCACHPQSLQPLRGANLLPGVDGIHVIQEKRSAALMHFLAAHAFGRASAGQRAL